MNKLLKAISAACVITVSGIAIADERITVTPPGEPEAYARLSANWWQWAVGAGFVPVNDIDGQFCTVDQPESDIWFLAGTFGNDSPIVRTCEIPEGRRLFFPLFNALNGCPFPGETIGGFRDKLASDVVPDLNAEPPVEITLSATIDGVPVEELLRGERGDDRLMRERKRDDHEGQGDLFSLRTQSEVFSFEGIDPTLTFFGVERLDLDEDGFAEFACPNVFLGDGYYVLVEPLSEGDHVIEFAASKTVGDNEPFTVSVTYLLTVIEDSDDD